MEGRALGKTEKCLQRAQDGGQYARGRDQHCARGILVEPGKERRADDARENDGRDTDDVVQRAKEIGRRVMRRLGRIHPVMPVLEQRLDLWRPGAGSRDWNCLWSALLRLHGLPARAAVTELPASARWWCQANGGRACFAEARGPSHHQRAKAGRYLLIGIMMCAPGVPVSISHGRPSPLIDSSRRLSSDTPIDSGVAPGTESTHSN